MGMKLYARMFASIIWLQIHWWGNLVTVRTLVLRDIKKKKKKKKKYSTVRV